MGVLGPGASLGEAALLGLLHVRTATVQAVQVRHPVLYVGFFLGWVGWGGEDNRSQPGNFNFVVFLCLVGRFWLEAARRDLGPCMKEKTI